jgi:hypothetical protein
MERSPGLALRSRSGALGAGYGTMSPVGCFG